MSEFRQRVTDHDVVGITETWENGNVGDAEITVDGFNIFRLDRKGTRGGGLALYIRDDLEATLNETLMNAEFKESIWCNVSLQCGNLLVGLCYRSPSSNDVNNDNLLKLLDTAYRSVSLDRE